MRTATPGERFQYIHAVLAMRLGRALPQAADPRTAACRPEARPGQQEGRTTMNNLWLADYDAAADAPQWVECAIERLTPKFVWCCGAKIDRAALEADGRASSSRHDLYCVKALVPANGKRITLADQAARWERRKA